MHTCGMGTGYPSTVFCLCDRESELLRSFKIVGGNMSYLEGKKNHTGWKEPS